MSDMDFKDMRAEELAYEREENARLRIALEASERAQELAIANGLKWQRAYNEARKQLQSWADEFDGGHEL